MGPFVRRPETLRFKRVWVVSLGEGPRYTSKTLYSGSQVRVPTGNSYISFSGGFTSSDLFTDVSYTIVGDLMYTHPSPSPDLLT